MKSEMHHSFDVKLAQDLKSIDLAVLIHHFQFWIKHNAATGRNFHEGRTWTFQTLKDIAAYFPYWSPKQVERLIIKLVELKILIKGNFNNSPYDRTVWYAFENEEMFSISRNREIDFSESGNQNPEIGKPIPDTLHILEKKKKKKSASLIAIEFDYDSKEFLGIESADISEWQKIYPGVDIQNELRKMRQWLIDPDNPERDGNRTFVTNWLSKAHKDLLKPLRLKTATEAQPIIEPTAGQKRPYDSSIGYGILQRDGEEAYIKYLNRTDSGDALQKYLSKKSNPEQQWQSQ